MNTYHSSRLALVGEYTSGNSTFYYFLESCVVVLKPNGDSPMSVLSEELDFQYDLLRTGSE
jgi:hypothetical protein